MKRRLTIEGRWELRGAWWVLLDTDGESIIMRCYDGQQSSVEDVSDPLPTEPGTTFWGQSAEGTPQRWFVVHDIDADGKPDPARVTYISQRYQEWSPSEAERYGLVICPDPSEASS